jgi:O-antigen/teichoic acid export membrane protein
VARAAGVLVATIAAIEAGAGLVGFVAAGAVAEILTAVAQAAYTLRVVKGLSPRLSRVDRPHVRTLTRFSLGVLALTVASQVVLYGNTVVLSSVKGAAAVAIYTVAARIVDMAGLALSQISDVFMPVLAGLDASGSQQRSQDIVRYGTLAALVVGIPVVGVLIAVGPGIVHAWVGDGFSSSAVPLALLAAGLAFNVPLRFLVLWSIGAGRHRTVALVASLDTVLSIGLSLALVFPFGVNGVALASLITFTGSNLLLLPWLIARDLELDPWRDYYRPLALALALVAPATIAVRMGLDGLPDTGTVVVLVAALAWTLVHVSLLSAALVPRSAWRELRTRALHRPVPL